MNTSPTWQRCCVIVTFVLIFVCLAPAQKGKQPADSSWIRDFALPITDVGKGRENQLNWDPRFHVLLQSSLRQRQFFWRDHGRFTALTDLVHTFIGVPGSVLLDQNRYVAIDGCVPHDCGDRGFVWIDTAPAKRTPLVFVATGLIRTGLGDRESQIHLWLFSSTALDWQKMPPQFVSSLTQWWNRTSQGWSTPEKIVLVSLVQPSGEVIDLSPSMFKFSQNSEAKK